MQTVNSKSRRCLAQATSSWENQCKNQLQGWAPPLGINIFLRKPMRSHWNSTETVLEPYWNIFKSIGTALKQYWNSTGTVLKQYWNSIGVVLVQYWNSIGTALKQYWSSTGTVLKQYWNSSTGAVLEQSWTNTETVLQQFSTREPLQKLWKGSWQPIRKKTEPYTCVSTCANAFQVGGIKSQNVGCGAQLFCGHVPSAGCAINRRSKERVPATDRSALQHPHTQRMDEYWDSTEIILEQYWYCTGTILEHHWNSTGAVLEQYWNSIKTVMK